MDESKVKVLVAEDLRTSRMVTCRLLTRWGFEPVPCENGQVAQEILAQPDGPRIAILDWMMPLRTGPEVCEWVSSELDAFVYTILLTSKTERKDLVAGLSAGAHAYISKPANPLELETWIKVGLRIVGYESELAERSQELRRYATQMETLARERAQQLIHADRMVTLGTMSAGIAHEINNAASLLSGNVQTLEKFLPLIRDPIEVARQQPDADPRLQFIVDEVPNILTGMRAGVTRIVKIVKSLKTYAHREGTNDRKATQLNDCIQAAVQFCENALKRTATIQLYLDSGLPEILAAPHQIEQVFVNMIVNACDAIGPDSIGQITITTRPEGNNVIAIVEDTGVGIPPELMEKIWDPFFTTKDIGKGTGLGLSISLGIIESHEGRYLVENRVEGGARFIITVPVDNPSR